MTDDDFLELLILAFVEPSVLAGSSVLVDGRPGEVIRIGFPYTCTSIYDVHHHDGEVVRYVVNDFNPHAPKVKLA